MVLGLQIVRQQDVRGIVVQQWRTAGAKSLGRAIVLAVPQTLVRFVEMGQAVVPQREIDRVLNPWVGLHVDGGVERSLKELRVHAERVV